MRVLANSKFRPNSKYLILLAMLYVVFCLSADTVANRFTQVGDIILNQGLHYCSR